MTGSRENLIRVAKGGKKAPLVLKNAFVLDVFLEEYHPCDVAIFDGVIAGIGSYSGENEIDLTGLYLIPGLIDSHVHIESSYLTPAAYAQAVMPFGVTSVIADPHEIANVCGEEGIRFMMKSAETVPLEVYFMLPSCVPATPFDHAGAVIDGSLTADLMRQYDFLGLGEMMNYPGVLAADADVMKKLSVSEMIDGHAPGLAGRELCAYAAAGIRTDHECMTPREALEKISRGLYVHMREGTLAKNVSALAAAVNEHNADRFTICTDDKHIDDILANGTVTDGIRAAVSAGLRPERAIRMATINAASCYHLARKGAIAPGYIADLAVCADAAAEKMLAVYKNGVQVAKNGHALFSVEPAADSAAVRHTVHIQPLSEQSLTAPFSPHVPVIQTVPYSLVTEKVYETSAQGLCHVAVIERHQASGHIGRAFVKGLELFGGAVAQTIGHDSHNMIVLGDNERDMRAAAAALGGDGGIAVAQGGQITAYLPLAIGGLMSDHPAAETAESYAQVVAAVERISNQLGGELLMSLAFLPLLVIPKLKISDAGLFDVEKFSLV